MPARIKSTKEKVTLTTESKIVRAVEREAIRRRMSRVEWINEAVADKLEALGKLP